MLSRNDVIAYREQARLMAMQIGLEATARALNLKPCRVRQWASRGKWSISLIRPHSTRGVAQELSQNVTPLEAMQGIMTRMSDRTKLAMARTAQRAFEHCDTLDEKQLLALPTAVALEKHGKNAQLAHNWSSQQTAVAVQVNVPLPTQAERDEMRSIDDKLDAIAAKLRSS